MANSDKNILITPNRNLSGQPEIAFTGFGNSSISAKVSDSTTATLNFESSGTNVLSLDSNFQTGTLFSAVGENKTSLIDVSAETKRVSINKTLEIGGSGGLKLPVFPTKNLPKSQKGLLVYDNTEKTIKISNGVSWSNSSFKSSIIEDGLVLRLEGGRHDSYPGTGTTWFDLSPNRSNGTISGSVSFSPYNNYATFGSGGSVSFSPQLRIQREKTISFWIRSDRPLSDVDDWRIGFLNNSGAVGVMFGMMYGVGPVQDLGFWGYGGENDLAITSNGTRWIELNYWVNVALTMDSNRFVRIYKNGIQQTLSRNSDNATALTFAMPTDTTNYFEITGGSWTSGFTYLNLGSVLVYNRTLTQSEIIKNFAATKGNYGFSI